MRHHTLRQVSSSLAGLSAICPNLCFLLRESCCASVPLYPCRPQSPSRQVVMTSLSIAAGTTAPKQPPAWHAHICPFHAFQLRPGTAAVCAGWPPRHAR